MRNYNIQLKPARLIISLQTIALASTAKASIKTLISSDLNNNKRRKTAEPNSTSRVLATFISPVYRENINKIQEKTMNREIIKLKSIGAVFAAFLLTVFALVPFAKGQQIVCNSKSDTTKIVALEENKGADAVFNFPNDGVGHFSSTPLLSAIIEVGGNQRSCVVARFSAEALPLDNHIVYQVRIDGVPMKGHLPGFVGIATPVIADAEETDLNLERIISHDFFAVVEPGRHRVEVLFAGCCSGAPPPNSLYSYSGANVLVLDYLGI
jgi:hypothetical protein